MKRIVLASFVLGLGLANNAFADAKSDAQAKVDAAKTETCEKEKKFLAEQEAKGKCKDENAAAKKITCSAATEKDVRELQNKCIAAKPTKTDDKAADKGDAPKPGTKCRAVNPADEKDVFAEADDKVSTKCLRLLIDELNKKWCNAGNKGKKFEYLTSYEHTIGTGKFAKQIKGRKESLTCRVVNKDAK
jgi:hypothetical protein